MLEMTVMWQHAFAFLQKIGKALMLPVSVLPVAGILLGIGSAHFAIFPDLVSNVMAQSGGAIFGIMAIMFAIGVALGLTNNDGVSALAALVGYVVLLATLGVMAKVLGVETKEVMGIASVDTGCLAASSSAASRRRCSTAITGSACRRIWASSPASASCRLSPPSPPSAWGLC
jgi:phosphotransferase system  glucose/maltose/N-acetylglucosamine-specific IIC component